jgi:hypothetical protein
MAEKCHRTEVMSSRVGKMTTERHINTWTGTPTEQRDPQWWERSFDQLRMTAGDSIAINGSITLPELRSVRARFHPKTNSDEAAQNRLAPHTNTLPKR